MVAPLNSFWGNPTLEPREKDVARFVGTIREMTQKQSDKRALSIATSALQAIAAFVAERFGPREALALLDRLRGEIIDEAGRQ